MKRTLLTVLLGSIMVAALFSTAAAFDNKQAGIGFHIMPANWTPQGCTMPGGLKASTMNFGVPGLSVPGVGPYYWTYLLVCNASDSTGIAGVECGIDYAGGFDPNPVPPGSVGPICVFNWQSCGDLEFQSTGWPAPGGGNAITWTTAHCHPPKTEASRYSVIALAGYFYMGAYAPAQMFVIPRPVTGLASVADCAARQDILSGKIPSQLGVAGWVMYGYNPCFTPVPVTPSTWGGIKSLYNK